MECKCRSVKLCSALLSSADVSCPMLERQKQKTVSVHEHLCPSPGLLLRASGGMGSKASIWPWRCTENDLSYFALRADRLNTKLFVLSFEAEITDIKLHLPASLFKDFGQSADTCTLQWFIPKGLCHWQCSGLFCPEEHIEPIDYIII